MNLNNLFENREPYQLAIDKLEQRRIEDLEMKMDDLAARAKESNDPKHVAALRQAFAKAKAERDSYHRVNEHGGGGGNPAEWHAYVRAHRADEGWSERALAQRTGQPPTPYGVYIDGKQWKEFPTDDQARAVARKLEAKFKADGSNKKVSFSPAESYLNKSVKEEWSDKYKSSINCSNPKGFSQKAHCAAKTESADPEQLFDQIEEMIESLAEARAIDPELIWEYFESKTDQDLLTEAAAWQKKSGKNKNGGLNAKGVASYRRANPGSKLQTAVTTKPSKLKKGSKAAKRRKSFCARMGGVKGPMKKPNGKPTRKALALRKWNCEESIGEGYHTDTIAAMSAMAPTFQPGDAILVRNQAGDKVLGQVTELRPGIVVFKTEDGKRYRAPEGRVVRAMPEGSMRDAEHNPSGAKFGGYYGGTQAGAPRPGQGFGAESVQHEGAKVDRMVRHIEKSERSTGKSKKDAEAIAWATANKRGMLDNVNKRDEGMNFMEWAVAQGSRFNNFASDPEVYTAAKEAYVAEGMSNALSNITRRMAQPVNAKTIIKNREQKKDSIKRQHFAEEEVDEDWQKANKKDKTDGMSKKAVKAYRRENPGSKLKTAVTTKPSKLKKGSKPAKRRKSYCSRSKGQMKMHNISCAKTPDKAICKARRRWNCESQEQFDAMLREAVEKGTLQPGQYYVWTVYFDDGTNKRIKVTKDNFDPKAYYAKQNKVVVNVDYNWTPNNG